MSIIISAIKRCARDKMNILSVLFVTLLLPYLFSTAMYPDDEDYKVNMYVETSSTSSVSKAYKDFIKEFDKSNDNIEISYKEKSQLGSGDLIVKIDEANKKIIFDANGTMNSGPYMIEDITQEYFNQISTYEISSNIDIQSQAIGSKIIKENNITKEEEIDGKAYFAITMLLMSTLTSSISAFKNTFYLKESNGKRVLSSPMPTLKLITLESAGSFVAIFLQAIIVLIMDTVLYGVKINLENILPISALLALLSLLAVSIGIFTSAIAKKKENGDSIVVVIVLIITMFSGQMSPQMDLDGFIFNINPFKWINQSIFGLVQGSSNVDMTTTIGITLLYTVILTVVSAMILKKKAVD